MGKNGKTFQMLKFRSMCVDAEAKLAELKELNEKTGPVFKIADDPRITRVGKWLRKLSLDELPQFVNVLRSDMSVVGPRPALPNEVATYNDYQRQRLLVKPGMTLSLIHIFSTSRMWAATVAQRRPQRLSRLWRQRRRSTC